MDQDKKTGTGAPSTDTTSALFVSQRKKQLEQQEADRRAQEKEKQRLEAEAEVRRLEQEVEDRKRKAEEEAKRVAEEAVAQKARAAADPNSVLGTPGAVKEKKELKLPSLSKVAPGADGAAAKPMDTKKIAIIGGAVAVVILILVIIAVAGGKDDRPSASGEMIPFSSAQKGLSFSYPDGWQVSDTPEIPITLVNDDMGAFVMLLDITNEINQMTDSGMDIVTTVETMLQGITEELVGGPVNGLEPQLQKSGSLVTGSASFSYQDETLGKTNVDLYVTVMGDRILVDMIGTTDESKAEAAYADYRAIMDELEFIPITDATSSSGSDSSASTMTAPEGYKTFTSSNGLAMICPEDWSIADTDGGMRRSLVAISNPDNSAFMMVANYADESTGLVGRDIYDLFLKDALRMLELDISLAEDMQEVKGERSGDRGEHYAQWVFFPNNLDMCFSTVIFNDDKGTVQGVIMAHSSSDEASLETMNTIMESIDVA